MCGATPLYRGPATGRLNAETFCPGCGRHQWLIGARYAECAICAAALPLERHASRAGHWRWQNHTKGKCRNAAPGSMF